MPAASRPALSFCTAGEVLARVADEHGVVGHLALGRQEALRRRRSASACGRLAARRQRRAARRTKLLGAAVDARAHAHLLQERHEALVLARVVVGQHLADVARVRQALALGHAQEQARQPVGEVAADEQQVVVLELVEQLLGRQVLALQRADELEHVLVGDHVGRRGGQPAEQVIDDRPLQAGRARSAGRRRGWANRRSPR